MAAIVEDVIAPKVFIAPTITTTGQTNTTNQIFVSGASLIWVSGAKLMQITTTSLTV